MFTLQDCSRVAMKITSRVAQYGSLVGLYPIKILAHSTEKQLYIISEYGRNSIALYHVG